MHQEYVSARSTSQNSLSGLYTSLRSFLLNAREIAEDRLYALYALAQGAGAETEGGSEKVKAKVEKATERAKKEL